MASRGGGRERGFGRSYSRGLQAAARDNASAYGYSVTITSTFGVLSAVVGTPGVAEIFAFAGGAVIAFAAMETAVSRGFRHDPTEEPARVRALGSSFSLFSVGSSLVVALAAGQLVGGFAAWPLGAFLATVVYLLAFALEIAVAERLRGNRSC